MMYSYFGGGTVLALSAHSEYVISRDSSMSIHELFEDGTSNFHAIAGLFLIIRSELIMNCCVLKLPRCLPCK